MNEDLSVDYIIPNDNMPFDEYIKACSALIRRRRILKQHDSLEKIIAANSPFAWPESSSDRYKTGLLFTHGLLDSPFSFHDLANRFQEKDMLCQGILLPGHGTRPDDLMHVHYQNWIDTVDYGIQDMLKKVEKLFLVGYSTGAALSVYHALKNPVIAGILLIAPAIQIKFPIDPLLRLQQHLNWFPHKHSWIKQADEIDYVKYRSIPYHAVREVWKLTNQLARLLQKQSLNCPLFIAVSEDDETISSEAALEFFQKTTFQDNQLLFYTTNQKNRLDKRIIQRNSHVPAEKIDHFSHISLPFSPDNSHYGKCGDYLRASHTHAHHRYGAYLSFEGQYYALLNSLGLISTPRRELTYNPDFDYLSESMLTFIEKH